MHTMSASQDTIGPFPSNICLATVIQINVCTEPVAFDNVFHFSTKYKKRLATSLYVSFAFLNKQSDTLRESTRRVLPDDAQDTYTWSSSSSCSTRRTSAWCQSQRAWVPSSSSSTYLTSAVSVVKCTRSQLKNIYVAHFCSLLRYFHNGMIS